MNSMIGTWTFRDAAAGDCEAVMALWRSVFPAHDEAHWRIIRDQLDADPDRRAIGIRLMEQDGRLIGAVRNTLRWIRAGTARLLLADVGYVGVRPELQGRGLGRELMLDNSRWLQTRGVHLGRLGGLARFYQRFGWSRFPSQGLRLSLRDHAAGTRCIPFRQAIELDSDDRSCIEMFDKHRHWDTYIELSHAFHARHNGSEIFEGDHAARHRRRCHEQELCRYVFQRPGKPASAYLFATVPGWHSYDLGCAPGKERDLGCLIKHYLLAAHDAGLQAADTCWPDDVNLHGLLIESGLAHERVEAWGGLGSNMVKIVDLAGLLARMRPVLAERFAAATISEERRGARLVIELDDCGQSGSCELTASSDAASVWTAALQLDQSSFVRLVLGMDAPSRLQPRSHPPAPHSIPWMEALFPSQPFAPL